MYFSDIGKFLEKRVLNHRKKNSKLINFILFLYEEKSFTSLDPYTVSDWEHTSYLFSLPLQDKHFKDIKTQRHPSASAEQGSVCRDVQPSASWI